MARAFDEFNLVRLLRTGELKLECSKVELTREDGGDSFSYRGPGCVWQNAEGQLRFKVYPTAVETPASELPAACVGTAGQLVPDDRYFSFASVDVLGRRWTSRRILPEFVCSNDTIIAVEGLLRELVTRDEREVSFRGGLFDLHYFEELDLPCNANTSEYRDTGDGPQLCEVRWDLVKLDLAGCKIAIFKQTGEFTVRISSDEELPINVDTRVTEALQFALARSLQCRAIEHTFDNKSVLRLISRHRVSPRTQFPPPIALSSLAGHEELWRLFERYLQYILKYDNADWHPCSIYLHTAREASANSFEAAALGLAVAVEGLTKALFPPCPDRTPAYKSVVEDLTGYVDKWPGVGPKEIVDKVRARLPGLCKREFQTPSTLMLRATIYAWSPLDTGCLCVV